MTDRVERHPDFQIADRGLPDIWRCQWTAIKPTGHPAEKPVSLLQRLISASGSSSVIDPFMGSGSTLVAAKNLGVKAIGIEVEERWCEIAAIRCSQEVMFGEDIA